MKNIEQNIDIKLVQEVQSVEWLVNNTSVREFNPLTFEGYQRKIDKNHCDKIVKYLENEFFLPTSIICAKNENESKEYRIVDGQHRIEAFKILKKNNDKRYNEIKENQLSVICMIDADEKKEIDTFITINKASKRVDTSLAYILKNKINNKETSQNLTISKLDYVSVELAKKLTESYNKKSLWQDRISFIGPPRKGPEVISLSAFVRSTRRIVGQLYNKKIINVEWETQEDINQCLEEIISIFNILWESIYKKWPYLFESTYENRKIIQGSIGYSSISKYIVMIIKDLEIDVNKKLEHTARYIEESVFNINIDESMWIAGNKFSKYTSESGFNIIAKELYDSQRNIMNNSIYGSNNSSKET